MNVVCVWLGGEMRDGNECLDNSCCNFFLKFEGSIFIPL